MKRPRRVHVELFAHAWTIVDCTHVASQVLVALDYQTPLAVAFQEKYACARKLRNRMDHLTENARNVANAKRRPPVFGALGYICVPDENVVMQDGQVSVTGGGLVLLSTGRLTGGQRMTVVNPAGREMRGLVGGFRLEAFGECLELEEVVRDLETLMIEANDRLEKETAKVANALSKEHGVPVKDLMANPAGGLSLFLAFKGRETN